MDVAKILVGATSGIAQNRQRIPARAAGLTVSVAFVDSVWDNLTKTVVFRGTGSRIAEFDGKTAVIPWEVLAEPGTRIYFGIFGSDSETGMELPLIEVDIGITERSTDPQADPGTDPTLPIWAQLQEDVEELKQSGGGGTGTPGKPGADGEDGGYYTPAVTQPDEDTIQFNFNPSKPDMPTVEPVTVELPAGQGSGGNVELDTTLTQSGKAADAKAVGDKIAEITGVSMVEPAEDDIPKVFITGVKPTTKDDVLAEMEYISKTERFHAYLTIKCQGTSSMSYDKKNFTVKLYSDEARETKLKKDFKGWNHPGNKFVLKANYIDHTHARNIVSARLWGEVVKSRPDYASLPEEMRNSPNNGAVDGFPVKVYYNGTYEGVYTWNIGKDDWQWGMDEDNPNHVLLCAETSTDGGYFATPCNFRELWSGVHGSDWSVEVGTNSDAVKTSLNNLIQFVMDNDGDDFRNGIGNYLDVQSAIDYYVFQYEICGIDGLSKNMLLATYDGTHWICGAYDMDSTYGLSANGKSIGPATNRCPEDYYEKYSLLWERFEANFLPELKARQAELRKTVLSYSNMVTHFERFMDIIGLDLYVEDLSIYPDIPSGTTNNIKQLRNFIRDRQPYVDAEFAAMTEPVRCTGITLSAESLVFGAEGTQTLTATVTPDGCTDTVTWESNNTSVAIVDGGVVTAIANGSATITAKCEEYSASCSVSVSGIAEVIPCTGITLDKTELTFAEEGTQTIVATVTPADTTDKIVWVSGNESVATVNNGVVTAISDGTANITATCGNYSATCVVSVELPVSPILYRATNVNMSADVDTGVKLMESDVDFTVVYKANLTATPGNNNFLFTLMDGGYLLGAWFNTSSLRTIYGQGTLVDINMVKNATAGAHVDVVFTHKAGAGYCNAYARWGSSKIHEGTAQPSGTYTTTAKSVILRKSAAVTTVDEFAIYNYAMEKGEIVETVFGYSEQLVDGIAWSEKATCSIANGDIASGNRYVTNDAIAIPDGAVAARLNNVNSSVFTWHGIAQYDADMAFISYAEGNLKSTDIAVVPAENAKYVRFTASPEMDTSNVPATGLEASFLFETAE